MTISSEIMKSRFLTDGNTKIFVIPWKLSSKDSIVMYTVDHTKDPPEYAPVSSNYSVSPTDGGYPTRGASITYPVTGLSIPPGHEVVIMREEPLLQVVTFRFGGTYNPTYIETVLDSVVMEIQQVNELASRSIRLPVWANTDLIDPIMPYPEARKAIAWNNAGTGLENIDLDSKVSSADNSATQAAESATRAAASAVQAALQAVQAAASAVQAANSADNSSDLAVLAQEAASQASQSAQTSTQAAANSTAFNAPAWDNTKVYNYPDVVAYADGFSYRCIGTNVAGTNIPNSSMEWVRITLDTEDFWDVDNSGGLMSSRSPTFSSQWELDGNGSIMPKGE